MQFVDSRKEQLDYAQILHAYHKNIAGKDERLKDFTAWMTTLAAVIVEKKMEGAVIGNTIFYYTRGGAGSDMAMIWALNVDTMQNAVDNLIEMSNRLADAGITTLVSIYDSPAMSRIIRQAYQKAHTPEDDLQIRKLPSGQYVAQFTIGEAENV